MWRSITVASVLAAAFLTTAVPAQAQRWGRGATPRSGVCFYEDINFGGRYFCTAEGTSAPSVSRTDNDQISSIRVFGNAVTTVYRDPDFRGQSRVIDSSVSDLRAMGFNDRISSYEVGSARFNNNGRAVPRGSNVPYGSNGPYRSNAPYGSNAQSRWNYRDAERVVRQSYHQVLGRDPDPSGLRQYRSLIIDKGWSEQQVREALRNSPEFRELNTMTREKAEAIVRRAYLSVLRREPDAGAQGFVNRVLRDRWSEEDVARELRKSDEYRNKKP